MFELFKSRDGKGESAAGLTSLDLRSAAPSTAPPNTLATAQPKAPATAQPSTKAAIAPATVQPCVQTVVTLEGAYVHFVGAQRKLQEFVKTSIKPEVLFYLVFPQQGHSYSITTSDGTKTILPIFTTNVMADAYIAAKKVGAVAAACRFENLSKQAEQWTASGVNSYALNLCCRCSGLIVFPISEFQSEDLFLTNWRLDLANRRQFMEVYGRNASTVFGSNPKQARIWLEGIRDHVDPANPYLHWIIALLAGLADDMEASAALIKRLDAFGPPFAGKLQGTSFDPREPGSQMSTMPEAMVGLGISLGYLDPNKLQKKPD